MLSSTIRKILYNLSYPFGSTYGITFAYWQKAQIHAVLSFPVGTDDQPLVLDTDYSLTNPGATGTLTKLSDWNHAAIRLTIYRELNLDQPTDYRNGEAVDMDLLEQDFDLTVARDQQLQEEIERIGLIPITDEDTPGNLPAFAGRASKIAAWDALGKWIGAAGIPSVPATAFMATLLDDLTAPAALSTLGVSAFIQGLLDDASADLAKGTLGIFLENIKTLASEGYTVLDGDGYDLILVTTGASDRTVTLPTAADNSKRRIVVAKVDSGAGKVIVDGEGSETINGTATWEITDQWGHVSIRCNGTAWVVNSSEGSVYTLESASGGTQNTPTAGTWYNVGSHSLVVPAGRYVLEWQWILYANNTGSTADVFGTLSTADNSQSDAGMTASQSTYGSVAGDRGIGGYLSKSKIVSLAAATTFYLNAKTSQNNGISIQDKSSDGSCIIRARRIG